MLNSERAGRGRGRLHILRASAGAITLLLTLVATDASAQIGNIRDRVARQGLPNISRMLEGEPPVSTSLSDARFAVDSLDNFSPHDVSNYRARGGVIAGIPVDSLDNMPLRSMRELRRTAAGAFVLQPGYWELHSESYCLHAGTHGPGGGDGYLYAPPRGTAEEQIVALLQTSINHPDIAQQDIQTLLWAIVARARFEDLSPHHKAIAGRLLTPRQVATLNRNALDLLPGPALTSALSRMPPLVRQIYEAEAALRQMLVNPATTFDQLERAAVLTGAVSRGPGSRDVAAGRWSRHPDGYYVRYMPQGYSYTRTQIWVPERSEAVGREFDAAKHIAVPGNTARQRLAQSGRQHARHAD
jgi:hypothetical protein